jgi:imidazolonepropionase-like amidohydrolase
MTHEANRTLIKNVRIFDGENEKLIKGKTVTIEAGVISRIESEQAPVPPDCVVIDGAGCVLMPGIINAHYHMFGALPVRLIVSEPEKGYRAFWYSNGLEMTLMQGVTTVRDIGGNDWGVVKAAEQGMIDSPRIFASGALICQTAGHFDFRLPNSRLEDSVFAGDIIVVAEGMAYIADGPDAVRRAAREVLRHGATQVKISSGGGVASWVDPVHSIQFTSEEVQAAVEAAKGWDTYVATHIYTPEAATRDIINGVMSLEHANLVDEETVKLGVDKGVWWSPQTVVYLNPPKGWNEVQRTKLKIVVDGLENTLALFKKHSAQVLFGTDCVGNMDMQHLEFTYRSEYFTPLEILRQATSNGGRALRMSGRLYPLPGDLGIIQEGAMADMLIVKNNPLEDISILSDYEEQLLMIMKDGKVFKNLLEV